MMQECFHDQTLIQVRITDLHPDLPETFRMEMMKQIVKRPKKHLTELADRTQKKPDQVISQTF